MKVTEVKKRLWMMGWTQDALVRRTGRSKNEISMVLNGYRYTAPVQEAIARAVGVAVEELFGKWAYTCQKKRDRIKTSGVDSLGAGGRIKLANGGLGAA